MANIMEKLRERSISRVSNESRRIILGENSQNKLSPEFQSVLSPDSRKFLENQVGIFIYIKRCATYKF